MKVVQVKAPAKLNLALDITGRTENGYHLMQMVMQTIDLCDTVWIESDHSGEIQLFCNWETVPCDHRNICYVCATLFFERTGIENQGLRIRIEKKIPQQAGMAGGSTDGAAVLVGLNRLYQAGLGIDELCEIGAAAGADIPFCLVGGTAVVEGIGEKIRRIVDLPACDLVIAKPNGGISTQKAFMEFDRQLIPPQFDLEGMEKAIVAGDLTGTVGRMYNALERVCPLSEVFVIRDMMRSCGAKGAIMTGSGSAVFGIFTDRGKAYQCERKLAERYSESFLARPVPYGAQIIE